MKNLTEGWPLPHLKIYPKNRWFKLYLEEGHRKDEAYRWIRKELRVEGKASVRAWFGLSFPSIVAKFIP